MTPADIRKHDRHHRRVSGLAQWALFHADDADAVTSAVEDLLRALDERDAEVHEVPTGARRAA